MKPLVLPFQKITLEDIAIVGEKNASIGELINYVAPLGVSIPDGFAVTVHAFLEFVTFNSLRAQLEGALNCIDRHTLQTITEVSAYCRETIMKSELPLSVSEKIKAAYTELMIRHGLNPTVAVRSSGTDAYNTSLSFTGQYDSYLNLNGSDEILQAVKKCYASLFNPRAIQYRMNHYSSDLLAGISVGIQLMVHAEKACAGVAFSVGPDLLCITGSVGLGQGEEFVKVDADEFFLSKSALRGKDYSIRMHLRGSKKQQLIANALHEPRTWCSTTPDQSDQFILTDEELMHLGDWCTVIENHYQCPVNVEWAKDGQNGKLYIVQARADKELIHNEAIEKGKPEVGFIADSIEEVATNPHEDIQNLEILHHQSMEWLSELEFIKGKASFFARLLSKNLIHQFPSVIASQLSAALVVFNMEQLNSLHFRIIEHERWLADIIRTDTLGRQVSYREIHQKLSQLMNDCRNEYQRLKKEIMSYAENVSR